MERNGTAVEMVHREPSFPGSGSRAAEIGLSNTREPIRSNSSGAWSRLLPEPICFYKEQALRAQFRRMPETNF